MLAEAFPSSGARNVFLSFVPSEEKALRRKLIKALSPLARQGLINLWSDEEIPAGYGRAQEIAHHLQASQIILLPVSPACLASETWNRQAETILELVRGGRVKMIPVLLRETVAWREAPFGHLSPLPASGKAVTSFNKQDEGWFAVATGLYDLVAQAQQSHAPAVSRLLRTQPPTPHPVKSIPRPQVVSEIYQRLTAPDLSSLVLTGIWGLGKSELAAQVCQFAEAQRQAGQGPFLACPLWLNLEETASLLDVCGTLCEAYGVAVPSFQHLTASDLAGTLFDLLQQSQQPRLVVLNQLENWLDPQTRYPRAGQPGVGEWLELLNSRLCPSRVLFTSRLYPHGRRQRLDSYVQRLTLPGLSLAEGLQLLRLGELAENDEERAFAISYYQGHPLALAWLRDLLTENRSLSLAALMHDISYKQLWTNDLAQNIAQYIYMQQLNQEQRELLLAFAIYRQAVPLQAAQRILQARSSQLASQASAALRFLLDQDLLQAVGNLEYRLQPVIKDFVQTQAREADPHLNAAQVCQAHRLAASYYQERFADALSRALQPSIDAFRLLLEAAWHICQAGQLAEAAQLMRDEQLFLYLNRWGGNSLLLDLYQQLLPTEKWDAPPLVAGQLYHEMGTIQNALGQKQNAQMYYERALPFLRQVAEPVLIAEALNDLGSVYRALTQEARARECYEEAWALCEQEGERFAQRGVTLNNLGRLLYEQGQEKQQQRQKAEATALYQEAQALYERALTAHQSNDQPEEAGWTLLNLGDVYASLDQRDQTRGYYQQALKQLRALGERRGEGTVLNNLGLLMAYERTTKEEAASCYLQALRIFRAVGDRWQERKVLRNLGHWLMIYVPKQEPARSQAYISGLACFFAARDVLEKQPQTNADLVPGWLLASLRQDMGAQKTEELLLAGEARSWQIIEELLRMPHNFM